MNLLNKLTLKNLKLNKKRTIVTIIGIILSVALITAVTSMFFSAYHSIIKYETSIKGDFHYEFMNVSGKDLKTFENNRNIEEFGIVKNIGYANLIESQNEYKPYAYIKAFDNKAFANLAIKLISGRLPKNDNEIVIPSHLKTNGRVNYKVGDTITLEVGKRVQDGFELNQDNNKTDEFEEIIDTMTKSYKIVGIIKRPSNYIESYEAPGYTFITYLNKIYDDNDYDLYVKYNSKALKHESEVTADILNVPREAYKSINDYEIISKLNEKQLAKISKQMEKAKYNYVVNSLILILLKLAKFDSNTIVFKRQNNDLLTIINEASMNVSALADLKNIEININSNDNINIYCDYKWEVEALTNIIKNCIEYSLENSKIDIFINDNNLYTKLTIKDYGKGMDKEEIKNIFKRFYKGNNSFNDSIGIGLSLAKNIIEKDNCLISVKSKKNNGTEFNIKYFKN